MRKAFVGWNKCHSRARSKKLRPSRIKAICTWTIQLIDTIASQLIHTSFMNTTWEYGRKIPSASSIIHMNGMSSFVDVVNGGHVRYHSENVVRRETKDTAYQRYNHRTLWKQSSCAGQCYKPTGRETAVWTALSSCYGGEKKTWPLKVTVTINDRDRSCL